MPSPPPTVKAIVGSFEIFEQNCTQLCVALALREDTGTDPATFFDRLLPSRTHPARSGNWCPKARVTNLQIDQD